MASRTRPTRSKHFRPSRPAAHEQPASVSPDGKESEDDDGDEQYRQSDSDIAEPREEDEEYGSEDSQRQSHASGPKRKAASKPGAQVAAKRKRETRLTAPTGIESKFIPNRELPETEREYTDETIHCHTLEFLRKLAESNNRDWFSENDIIYRAAKADFDSFITILSEKITEHVDTTVPELPLKDLIFRIYRDIRFSNDQTPYKVYFSAAWSRTGRKGPYAHYYLQIQPQGKSMVGGGLWHVDSQPLALLRQHIARNPDRLKRILASPGIAEGFLELNKHVDENQAVDAFVAKNSEDALKSAPKGYPKDHVDIKLLRLRSFTVGKRLQDEDVTSSNIVGVIVDLFSKMEPLITYLNSVIMPDVISENSSDEQQ
ncbi:hypothetical protein DFH27DRAFT_606430 [Peziza echinospora]|nr:hypothetical protein DFH27DRAFT_606430 [Peziza echinospora]